MVVGCLILVVVGWLIMVVVDWLIIVVVGWLVDYGGGYVGGWLLRIYIVNILWVHYVLFILR